MDSLMGNADALRLAAARLRRDADLVATMGIRVNAASDRVVFSGPAADRLRADALTWRGTSNAVAQQLISVAELLDRAAQEIEFPGSTSAVGLAAWGGFNQPGAAVGLGPIQTSDSIGTVSLPFEPIEVGGPTSASIPLVFSDPLAGFGQDQRIGSVALPATGMPSSVPITFSPSFDTAPATSTGSVPLVLSNPIDGSWNAGVGSVEIPLSSPIGWSTGPSIGTIPLDMPMPVIPSYTYNPPWSVGTASPSGDPGANGGAIVNNILTTQQLNWTIPNFYSPVSNLIG